MSVLRKFAADGPTAAELAKVRENLKRARETAVKQNAFWQQVLEERVLWGDDPEDNMRTFDTRVATLDAESIRALARIVDSHVAAMKTFVNDVPRQIALEGQFSKLPPPVIAMVQKDFLRLSYHTNMADLQLMSRQMHEIGWAKTDHSGDLGKFVNLHFLEKATSESAQQLSTW